MGAGVLALTTVSRLVMKVFMVAATSGSTGSSKANSKLRQRASRALLLKMRPEKAAVQLLPPAEEVTAMTWQKETEKVAPVAALELTEPLSQLTLCLRIWSLKS